MPSMQVMVGLSDDITSQVLSGGSTITTVKSVVNMIAVGSDNKNRSKNGKRAKAQTTDRRLLDIVLTALHSLLLRCVDTGCFLKGGVRMRPSTTEEYVVSVTF